MFKLLKTIYRFGHRILSWLKNRLRKLFNYWIPNWKNILFGKIVLASNVRFDQYTLIEGAGKVKIGQNCTFGCKLGGFHRGGSIEIQTRFKNAKIIIENNVATNNNIFLCAANLIKIGKSTRIGHFVTVMDFEAHSTNPEKRNKVGKIGQVIIGENVWIGNNVTILKNSEIGKNTIVAAGAVVAGKFPSNVIIGGIPAKMIKSI